MGRVQRTWSPWSVTSKNTEVDELFNSEFNPPVFNDISDVARYLMLQKSTFRVALHVSLFSRFLFFFTRTEARRIAANGSTLRACYVTTYCLPPASGLRDRASMDAVQNSSKLARERSRYPA